MATIKCNGCGRLVSDQLIACPDCGEAVLEHTAPGAQKGSDVAADEGQTAAAKNAEGLKLLSAANYEAAVRAFNEAIALDPDYSLAHRNRAAALSGLGRQVSSSKDPETQIAMIVETGKHSSANEYHLICPRSPR